jgi:hypothetical protein
MLDVSFFRKPRFTAASASITLVFFALFGTMFLLTQYLQFVLGYSPLETGIRLLPFAAGMMIFAPLSARVVERIGTKLTVALGLGLVTTGLLTMIGLQTDTPYSAIWWRLLITSAGMGLTMAPATDSVMGSLPLFKAGVGSAVNDTTRQVGGALGVAVVGSVLATTYGDRIAEVFAGTPVPAEAVDAATSSIGAVPGVAQQLTQNGLGTLGTQLQTTANEAFVTGTHWGVAVAAAATGLGVLVALLFLPAQARPEDREEQQREYEEEHRGEGYPEPASGASPSGPPSRGAVIPSGEDLLSEPLRAEPLPADPGTEP